jgi:5'-methylthioadenosine phosphorylase
VSEPQTIELAIIGGSGFYELPGIEGVEEIRVETPFGPPSDVIRVGMLRGVRIGFLARHGAGHRLLPSELPQRANMWALKSLGVQRVLGVSAVGGLKEECSPGTAVVPDQIVDRTRGDRPETFFGEGIVAHIGMAEPFCGPMRAAITAAAREGDQSCIDRGTYVVIEGPAFGTRAESNLYRRWDASIVGMTAYPEAKLAREAELCYALLTTVTDYDAWHPEEEAVDAATVLAVLRQNVAHSLATASRVVEGLPDRAQCGCSHSLDPALMTAPDAIPDEARAKLEPILKRRLGL